MIRACPTPCLITMWPKSASRTCRWSPITRMSATHLFDLALEPVTGGLWLAATDARNLVRFEPSLRRNFVDNQVSRLDPAPGPRRRTI